MMKVYKFGMLVASVGLVFGLITGCGGGGSDVGGIYETPSVITDDGGVSETPSVTTIEDILENENKLIDEFVSQSFANTDALNEMIDVYETAILGIDVENLSGEELVNELGEDKAEAVFIELNALFYEKFIPSLTEAQKAHSGIVSSEEQISEIMFGTVDPFIAGGLVTNEYSKASNLELAAGPFTIAVSTIAVFSGTYLACRAGINEELEACKKAFMASNAWAPNTPQNVKDYTTFWHCFPQYLTRYDDCLADFALTAWSSAGSIAAAGFKEIQFGIDYVSGLDLGLKVKKLLGYNCDPEEKEPKLSYLEVADSIYRKDILNPNATTIIAQGENSTFLVPEGGWSFLLFADGAARQVTECIDVSGDENLIKESITMTPISEVQDLIDDGDEVLPDPNTVSVSIQVNIPGYTPPFSSNLTEMSFASLDDGPRIYPSFTTTDANNPEELNYESDIFFMIFNTTLSAGNTYLLSEEGEFNANVRFATGQIVDEDGAPITFSEVSGSVTLTEYGTNVGDRLSGSFSCDVVGKRSEDVVINGNISGTFSGTLSAVEDNSAVSKSMKVSF